MKAKLHAFLKSEGLKPSQLAEMLEINPAGVSHILAGRNKPGFDLLQKILRRFPRINPDWLLLDSDKMYRDDVTGQQPSAHASSATESAGSRQVIGEGLFGQPIENPKPAGTATGSDSGSGSTTQPDTESSAAGIPFAAGTLVSGRRNVPVERVVIFYADRTFESFSPTMR